MLNEILHFSKSAIQLDICFLLHRLIRLNHWIWIHQCIQNLNDEREIFNNTDVNSAEIILEFLQIGPWFSFDFGFENEISMFAIFLDNFINDHTSSFSVVIFHIVQILESEMNIWKNVQNLFILLLERGQIYFQEYFYDVAFQNCCFKTLHRCCCEQVWNFQQIENNTQSYVFFNFDC